MTSTHHGNLHLHKRKPPLRSFFDKAIYVVAIGGPLILLPQTLKIWMSRNAESTSLITFIGFVIISVFWIIYGVIHKDKPILYTNILYALLHLSVVIGAVVYS